MKSGYIAIVGRPNVGKSTLLNHFIGEKISIISKKAQTTRHNITGILTTESEQFVFVDTPGFQIQCKNALNKGMNKNIKQILNNVDVIIFMLEANIFNEKDNAVLNLLCTLNPEIKIIIAINKTDKLKTKQQKENLLPFIQSLQNKINEKNEKNEKNSNTNFVSIIPIGAEKHKQTEELLNEIKPYLPNNELLFAADEITTRNERFLSAEYIREKLFRLLGDELPYNSAVEIEKFETVSENFRKIYAAILVEKPNHKGIVIGKNGESLKRIATSARKDMEKLFGGKIYLELWVKVKSGWADDQNLLKSLGYD